MKKILTIIAIVALAIGLGGCKEKNDVSAKKFQFIVEDVDFQSVTLTIIPASEDIVYASYIEFKNTFFNFPINKWKEMFLPNTEPATVDHNKLTGLFPGTEYVIYSCEKDENGELVGDIEYVIFKTDDIEIEDAPEASVAYRLGQLQTGTVEPEMNHFIFTSSYTEEHTGIMMNMALGAWKTNLTGSFTTEDMRRFCFFYQSPYFEITDGETSIRNYIYRAEFTGTYDEATDTYTYSGWCDAFDLKTYNKAVHLPFHVECKIAEEEQSE